MNVTSWRGAGENVFASLHKGQPVVVYGRCSTRNYEVNEQPRTSYELEATALGHDLFRGVTSFERGAPRHEHHRGHRQRGVCPPTTATTTCRSSTR